MNIFLGLLRDHGIEAVIDTRSYPKSKFAPQFDSGPFQELLRSHGITYYFLGGELGGRPQGSHFYDSGGHVLYGRVAESEFFRQGIDLLLDRIRRFRVAILCSEEDPSVCHRRLLIARVLTASGVAVTHIRGDGTTQSEAELLTEEATRAAEDSQLALFEHSPVPEWKSILSVSPRRPLNNSSLS